MSTIIESFWFQDDTLFIETYDFTFKIKKGDLLKSLKDKDIIIDYNEDYVIFNQTFEGSGYDGEPYQSTKPVSVHLETFVLNELTEEDVEIISKDKFGYINSKYKILLDSVKQSAKVLKGKLDRLDPWDKEEIIKELLDEKVVL